jgi:hypothetical protein
MSFNGIMCIIQQISRGILQFLHTCKPNLGLITFYITWRRIYTYHATHPPSPPFPGKANGPCLNRKLLLCYWPQIWTHSVEIVRMLCYKRHYVYNSANKARFYVKIKGYFECSMSTRVSWTNVYWKCGHSIYFLWLS